MKKTSILIIAALLAVVSVQAQLLIDFDNSPVVYTTGDVDGQDNWGASSTSPGVNLWNQIDPAVGGVSNELRTVASTYAYREITSEVTGNDLTVSTLVTCYNTSTYAYLRVACGSYLAGDAIANILLDARVGIGKVSNNGVDISSAVGRFASGVDYKIVALFDFTAQQVTIEVWRPDISALVDSGTTAFNNTKTLAEAQANTQIFLYSSGSSTFWDDVEVEAVAEPVSGTMAIIR